MAARFTTTHAGFPLSWLQKIPALFQDTRSIFRGHCTYGSPRLNRITVISGTAMSVGRSSSTHAHLQTLQTSPAFRYFIACHVKKSGGILKKMNPEYLLEIG